MIQMTWQKKNAQVARAISVSIYKSTWSRTEKWRRRDISGQYHPYSQARELGSHALEGSMYHKIQKN